MNTIKVNDMLYCIEDFYMHGRLEFKKGESYIVETEDGHLYGIGVDNTEKEHGEVYSTYSLIFKDVEDGNYNPLWKYFETKIGRAKRIIKQYSK